MKMLDEQSTRVVLFRGGDELGLAALDGAGRRRYAYRKSCDGGTRNGRVAANAVQRLGKEADLVRVCFVLDCDSVCFALCSAWIERWF